MTRKVNEDFLTGAHFFVQVFKRSNDICLGGLRVPQFNDLFFWDAHSQSHIARRDHVFGNAFEWVGSGSLGVLPYTNDKGVVSLAG